MKQALIIGAGPAGISAALYLTRSREADVTVISSGSSALLKAEKIENYYGFAEPISGAELYENGLRAAARLGVRMLEGEVLGLQILPDMRFQADTTLGLQVYDAVMIATGSTRKAPKIEGLKSFEGKGVSYCAVCDAFFYRGKPVVVIGSGEYAAHEAAVLKATASSVTILTDGLPFTGSLPEGVSLSDTKIRCIEGERSVEAVVFEDGSRLETAGVFVAIGTAGSTDLAKKVGAVLDGNYIMVDRTMATSIPGLFAGGDCVGGLLQVAKAVSDGAVAALSITQFFRK